MTHRLAVRAAGALLCASLALACGKYGPPGRSHAASATPSATSSSESIPAGTDERDSEPGEAPR
jgi:hypothetical protein